MQFTRVFLLYLPQLVVLKAAQGPIELSTIRFVLRSTASMFRPATLSTQTEHCSLLTHMHSHVVQLPLRYDRPSPRNQLQFLLLFFDFSLLFSLYVSVQYQFLLRLFQLFHKVSEARFIALASHADLEVDDSVHKTVDAVAARFIG